MMITRLRGGEGARGLRPTSKTSITQSRGVCVPLIGSCTHHVPFRMRDPMITRRTILMRHPRRAPPIPTTTRADRRTPAASHVLSALSSDQHACHRPPPVSRFNSFDIRPKRGFYQPAFGSTYPPHSGYYPPPQANHRTILTVHSMHTRHPKCIHRRWLRMITPCHKSSRANRESQARKM
jgi:hypothetical protein